MTKKYAIIIAFILIFVIIIGFQVLNKSDEKQVLQISSPSEVVADVSGLGTQTNNEGPVSIAVTPKNLSDNEWAFEIALNTHSVDINEDLTTASILIDEEGNDYKPVEWQGDPVGGHHRRGILRFTPILSQSQSIILKIFRVGGIKERNFIWQLK